VINEGADSRPRDLDAVRVHACLLAA
jgi:hypothetical protein